MAERRMFSKSVIGSARFLRMPPSSRLLYYDLGMAADDDGVVEAFSVMRMTGAVEDDLKVLVSKGFITVLNEDLVAYIEDWSKNNQIRKDRYQPSIYQNLLVQIGAVNQLETVGQPDGNQRLTQDRPCHPLEQHHLRRSTEKNRRRRFLGRRRLRQPDIQSRISELAGSARQLCRPSTPCIRRGHSAEPGIPCGSGRPETGHEHRSTCRNDSADGGRRHPRGRHRKRKQATDGDLAGWQARAWARGV